MTGPTIVVYGATGLVGGRVCAALDAADVPFVAAGRNRPALEKLARLVGATDWRVAELEHAELVAAFHGARVVVNTAGPLADVAEPVLLAALAAGAHYVDVGGDQAMLHLLFERHDAAARKAGRVVVPGCGLNCAVGDWAAAWAAMHVCDVSDPGPGAGPGRSISGAGDVVRQEPMPRLAEDRPLDEIAVSYVFDDLVLSPASQKAVFGNIQKPGLAWVRDRWEQVAGAATQKRVNAGPAMGGERDAVSFPGGDVITVPRHIAAKSVQTYVSTTRSGAATAALRLLARAMPLVPKRAAELLAPYQPHEEDYARTRFAVVAQARRGFSAAQIVASGDDMYRASAGIAAWVARALATRTAGPIGMRAPSELFRPELALRAVAAAVGLTIEPSFG